MTSLFDRLQAAVGGTYRLEEELGGGGMSRVFLAEEAALHRRVVIKLLPPEMAGGVSVDRFEREIQLAASLQHPHIVPLLTAGAQDDLLYYVMPYIAGESLRARLNREGELPVAEALTFLGEIADALAYAHRQNVIHRDIKPDNVMISEGHALVTDFGVAKAVSSATGADSLTSIGLALGTPAYMSPEQAAANPNVDHRADIYSLGALAYEVLCGRPPFTGANPQQVLAAQVTQAPESCTAHRPSIPPALEALVMRCLEKRPADRWQRADDLRTQIVSMATPESGALTPVAASSGNDPEPVTTVALTPGKLAAVFGVATAVVLVIVYGLMTVLGLPDWVFVGAVALLAVGLPLILVTGKHEHRRAVAATSGMHVTTPVGLARHFTWRKSILGGGLAFVGLAVVAGGFMTMRLLGIGPVGTLVAAGVLDEEAHLVLADFQNTTSDSTLGVTVAELLRIDLNDSPVITLLSAEQVSEILTRMQRPENTRLTPDVASEVAIREGIRAYLTGDVRSVGESYVLTARLVSAETGEELMSAREQARTAAGIIDAVDRMSATVRERIGESYASLRTEEPLARYTTSSLEALQLYTQALQADRQGNSRRQVALLRQAVTVDSTFGMAWRRLGSQEYNRGNEEESRVALERAYALRERLSTRERYHVEAMYAMGVEGDMEKGINAYLALLGRYPADGIALNNVGAAYRFLGNWREAERWSREALQVGYSSLGNLLTAEIALGNLAAADTIARLFGEEFPDHAQRFITRAIAATASWDYAAADLAIDEHLEAYGSSAGLAALGYSWRKVLAVAQGRLVEAQRWRREEMANSVDAGRLEPGQDVLLGRLDEMDFGVWYGVEHPSVDDYLETFRQWLETLDDPLSDPPWTRAVRTIARLGQPARAQDLLDEYRTRLSAEVRDAERVYLMRLDAEVALSANRADDAISLLREARDAVPRSQTAQREIRELAWWLAEAYDAGGNADSAVAYYEQYLEIHDSQQLSQDRWFLPATLRRLGELYEQAGAREQAGEYYSRFIDLWENADPELQPLVDDARVRLAGLVEPTR